MSQTAIEGATRRKPLREWICTPSHEWCRMRGPEELVFLFSAETSPSLKDGLTSHSAGGRPDFTGWTAQGLRSLTGYRAHQIARLGRAKIYLIPPRSGPSTTKTGIQPSDTRGWLSTRAHCLWVTITLAEYATRASHGRFAAYTPC